MDRESVMAIIYLPQLLGWYAAERDFQRRADKSLSLIHIYFLRWYDGYRRLLP